MNTIENTTEYTQETLDRADNGSKRLNELEQNIKRDMGRLCGLLDSVKENLRKEMFTGQTENARIFLVGEIEVDGRDYYFKIIIMDSGNVSLAIETRPRLEKRHYTWQQSSSRFVSALPIELIEPVSGAMPKLFSEVAKASPSFKKKFEILLAADKQKSESQPLPA